MRIPLLKRKPFHLAELPNDLDPNEVVYQVRYTGEIFRDYDEYLNRLKLYRQRVWMCKISGKTNLTYEEALLSEEHAKEKTHMFPKELMASALQIIQYSMLPLKDLADMIAAKLNERLYVGAELYAKKDAGTYSCKVSKVLKDGAGTVKYEVAWLDRNKEVTGTSIVNKEDLIQKKPQFSRNFVKLFIRESTYRNAPWVLHDKLAKSHGISKSIPPNLKGKVSFKDGLLVYKKRKEMDEEAKDEPGNGKRKKFDGSENDHPAEESIKYPIDDLLVQPHPDDPVFTNCPSPSRDFDVPLDCFGDLLMVWDFVSSFGRLLHLWPFSLEDFEKAICHKKGNLTLLVETHGALLRVLIKDNGEYAVAVQKRRPKITLVTWTDYLYDFLEMVNIPELHEHTATIKRGHYGLLDPNAKLAVFRELINQALESKIVREKMDEIVEQRQALGVSRREEALEEARKKRAKKEQLKAEPDGNREVDIKGVGNASANGNHIKQNGNVVKKRNGEIQAYGEDLDSDKSESKRMETVSKQNVEGKAPTKNEKDLSDKEAMNLAKDNGMEVRGKSSKERREYYEREMEKRFVRTDSLGKDRNHNRYWWFQRDGRVFVKSSDSKQWGYYSSKEELNLLMGSLNCKGERERKLKKQLEKGYNRISEALEKRSKDLAQKIAMEDDSVVRRSTRVRAPPSKNHVNAFLEYVNKWKEE
ncbi:uncharacterized protein LOC126789845 [Argentina anserina]|uniref:uncharacterized protein LOC126789845 n=1 Tax=Argentina anserina TaxID=57926 RepID=UPI002176346F|nr:uncharacterized protein LOC126789845 [Potentilla anserina]